MSTKILHIEKLRALCIALVFLYHLEVPGFHNGFLGVDVFFVISGFLMASLYGDMTSRQQAADYFRRRMARILPAYYAVILITALFSFFLLLPHEIQMVMEQSIWAAFFLPNVGYWLDTSYFDHTNLRPLLNLWSLGIEVQFYLLFPLLLFIERRSRWLLGLLAVGSCLEYAILTRVDPLSAFFLLPGRLWEFLAGLGAAR
ncbi:MAG: acyltransferase family protein, partial [Pseudohongiellaceae bacterium]